MLRAAVEAGSSLGKQAKGIMDAGKLVPDEVILGLVSDRIKEDDCAKGFLFDGFPRTIPQAEGLRAERVKVDHVVEIGVDDEEIVTRMSGRRVHLPSGRTYHLEFNPPRVAHQDDITGEPLIQRDDDKEETVRERLAVYHAQSEPLVEYYLQWSARSDPAAPQFVKIAGTGTIEDIRDRILAALR
jgi:adenylate kinase